MNKHPKTDSQDVTAPIEMVGVDVATMQDPGLIVVENVNWSVATGEFWIVAAQQYSGKSDFLMTTAGLMPPANGCYQFFGNETRIFDESRISDRLRMGFIFENASLFHYLTVAENVALPLRYHKNLEMPEAMKAIDELLELTELKPIADVTPSNLPRSWLKRVGLARALTLRPEILLLDNPLGGLESRHVLWWLHFLNKASKGHTWLDKKPLTIIATTDDLRPWRSSSRKFALLKEKRFVPLGSWNDVMATDEPVVKELLAEPVETIFAAEK